MGRNVDAHGVESMALAVGEEVVMPATLRLVVMHWDPLLGVSPGQCRLILS